MDFFDWYLVLTPLFSALILLTLVSFKLSLKDEPQLSQQNIMRVRSHQKNKDTDQNSKQSVKEQSIWNSSTYLKTFSYLIRHHSFLEICMTKKSKNKLPMLCSLGIIALISSFLPNQYFLCIVGMILVIGFVIAQSFFEKNSENLIEQQREQFQQIRQQVKKDNEVGQEKKYVYLVYAGFSCASILYVCSFLYQNYFNSTLMAFGLTFLVNGILDLFLVRPIGFLLVSIGLRFHLRTQHLIQNQNLRSQIQNLPPIQISALELATNLSPLKKQTNSPAKVPRAVLRLTKKQSSENEGLVNALESLKKIKREKNRNGLITPLSKNNKVCEQKNKTVEEYSLNQLFHEQEKSFIENHLQQTPIANFNAEQSSCNQSQIKGKRRDSELIILQFKKNDDDQKQSDNSRQSEALKINPPNFIHSNLDDQDFSDIPRNRNEGSEGDSDNLKIIRLLDKKSINQDSDEDQNHSSKNDNFMPLHQKNAGLMCINEHGDEQKQIEEIDLNSPNKRRAHHSKSILESENPHQKKKKIKYTNNAKKRVIKFTSGEPYLEYLPNMLSKETNKHTKKSQPINFKNQFEVFEDRPPRKSLKKIKREPKINFGRNDENECPQAIFIEDL